jgi:putative DNA primase/helicase
MTIEPTVTVVPDAIVDAIILKAVPRAHYIKPHRSGNGYDAGGNGYAADQREGKPHQLEAQFTYLDVGGRPYTLAKKWRWSKDKKSFSQHHRENGRWAPNKPSGPAIPYRLPQLIAAAPDVPVHIFEGEKDADNGAKLGLVATTNAGGALNWTDDLNMWFVGKQTVIIHEDNDDAGCRRTLLVAAALHGIVPDIRVITYSELPEHGDFSNWLEQGGTLEQLLERVKTAKKAEPIELESVCAADIEIEAYDWLWPDRFALGKIGLVVGLPDVGKGQFFCYMVARVTTGGSWPCGEGVVKDTGNVVILTAEDSPSDTVKPRLMAAGADVTRVHFIKMVREAGKKRGFSLLTDLPRLARLVDRIGNVKMVTIDPISAYLGVGKIDSYRNTDVRSTLTPLSDLAEEKRLAVVAIMHFNKKVDVHNALLRVSDSVAFGAVARHVYAIIADDEHNRQLFVKAKNNLAKKAGARALAFTFHDRDVGADPKSGKRIVSPFIVFDPEPVDITATEAMEAANTAGANISTREAAEDFLRERLAAGPVKAADIEEEARANLISKRTLERAKQRLGIIARKEHGKMDGAWFWELPPDA